MKTTTVNNMIKAVFLLSLLIEGLRPVYAREIDTPALSKQVIPLDNGDPRPLIALAAKYGSAKGQISGKAAEIIKKRTGSDAPVFVEAIKVGVVPDQPGCAKIKITYSTSKEYAAEFSQQPQLEVAACPNSAE